MTGKTILIVEDNHVEREGLAAVLRQAGYNVLAASNGKEALNRLNGQRAPDVLLLDMLMSEMDGWEFLRMLRRRPDLLALPVIIVTGLQIANLEWARSIGARGLVHKPIDVDQLRDSLAQVFGSSTDLRPLPT